MRWLISAPAYVLLTCAALAQVGQIPRYSPVVTGGGSPATWTLEQNIGASGTQGISPYVIPVTFNTGTSDVPVFEFVQVFDSLSGLVTAVSIAGVTTTTCVQGTNNDTEQAWVCYGTPTALTTANVSITFTSAITMYSASGKITTTAPTPSSTGNSTAASGGTTSPQNVACSSSIPSNGVGVAVMGDFFASARNFTSVAPNQDIISNNISLTNADFASGNSVTAGAGGFTFTSSVSGTFTAWAAACWGP